MVDDWSAFHPYAVGKANTGLSAWGKGRVCSPVSSVNSGIVAGVGNCPPPKF